MEKPTPRTEETQAGLSSVYRALALLLKEEERKGSKPSDIQKIKDVMAKIEHRIYADDKPLLPGDIGPNKELDKTSKKIMKNADEALKTAEEYLKKQ